MSKNANFSILGSAISKARAAGSPRAPRAARRTQGHGSSHPALPQAGLAGALSGPGPFTLFAPDDDAFAAACKVRFDPLEGDRTSDCATPRAAAPPLRPLRPAPHVLSTPRPVMALSS